MGVIEEDVWKDPIKSVSKLETLGEDLLSIDLEVEVPNERIIIDRFPVPLRYPLSDELEIFYDDSKSEHATFIYFLQEELRFVEVMKRLWTLSPVFVQSNMADRDVFPEIKILARTNGLILEVYVGDPSKIEVLQKICLTHGLYVR